MTTERERMLSEFIDAWNAGRRPDVDDYLSRVPEPERGELADELLSFLTFAPTPSYDDAALEAIRSEPAVAEALSASRSRGGLLPAVLRRTRARLSLEVSQVADALVGALGLPSERSSKTAGYLERLERGELEPARVSWRVFDGLARVLGVPRSELEGAADAGGWSPTASPALVFRADEDAARAVAEDLEVLADALEAPGGAARDEVDDLFLGGR